jgi:hypothetical protein
VPNGRPERYGRRDCGNKNGNKRDTPKSKCHDRRKERAPVIDYWHQVQKKGKKQEGRVFQEQKKTETKRVKRQMKDQKKDQIKHRKRGATRPETKRSRVKKTTSPRSVQS